MLARSLLPYASHNMMPLLNNDTPAQDTISHKTAHGMLSAPHRPHNCPSKTVWGLSVPCHY